MKIPRRLVGRTAPPTPFYVFDARTLSIVSRRWKKAATSRARLFYPYKCNRYPGVLDHFARIGFGAEVNVATDLSLALARRIDGGRLILQGPAKTPALIDGVMAAGGNFVIDSCEDLAAVLGRARALKCVLRYLLRYRVPEARASQRDFGFALHDIIQIVRGMAASGSSLPFGLAFHLGTGIPTAAPYRSAIRRAGSLARSLRSLSAPVRVLDVGGGFSAAGETRHDDANRPQRPGFTDAGEIVSTILSEIDREIPGVDVWLEPGRALVSEAFHLVARVLRVDSLRVFLDASRASHGFFVARGSHPIAGFPKRNGRPRQVLLAGPLGTSFDVFARARMVPPKEGDIVVIGCVGAYNLIAANDWSGPVPPVLEPDVHRRLTAKNQTA